MKNLTIKKILIALALMFLLSWACVLPGIGNNSSEDSSQPQSGTPQGPLPAAVIEIMPIPGSRIPLDGGITFYFNQSMDRASVEAAINGKPTLSGSFTWENDQTVIFTPAKNWLPDTAIQFSVSEDAKAENGLSMLQDVIYSFKSINYLEPIQRIPELEADTVSPSSSISVSFNQPVVALGAEDSGLSAFRLVPEVLGDGRWLNTSTYLFTPEVSLEGGINYKVQLNQDLQSLVGAPLIESQEDWAFTTGFPEVITSSLDNYSVRVPLDVAPRIGFNTSMIPDEVEEIFTLESSTGEKISGKFEWAENNSSFTFIPNELLDRSTNYDLKIGDLFQQSFYTFTELSIVEQFPLNIDLGDPNGSFSITFSSELKNNVNYSEYISIHPLPDGFQIRTEINYQWDVRNKIRINAYFEPNTVYTVNLSEDLQDKWDQELGQDRSLTYRTGTYDPNFNKYFYFNGMWADPSNPVMAAEAVNISSVNMMVGILPLDKLLSYERSYWNDDGYRPADLKSWNHPVNLLSDSAQEFAIPLSQNGGSLEPGIYWLMASSAQTESNFLSPTFVVASHVSLVYKSSEQNVSVWAIDRRDQTPVSGQLVQVFDLDGNLLATGQTNSEGLFYSENIADRESQNYQTIVMMAEPGDEFFSLVSSDWAPYFSEFGNYSGYSIGTKSYVYTDRPIYRPGDSIHFRAILREESDGRYQIPDLSSVIVKINYDYSKVLEETEIFLSEFASATGSFKLPADAPTGNYWIEVTKANCQENCSLGGVNVPVAAYVKPSVDLQVDILNEHAMSGDDLLAETSVNYFFGQDAGGIEVEYRWYSYDHYFNIPGYSVGAIDSDPGIYYYGPFGRSYQEHEVGNSIMDEDGNLKLSLPISSHTETRQYFLSININEEGEQPIGSEDSVIVHPAEYYIGIKADSRVGKVGEEMGFDVKVVDWDLNPVGSKSMTASYYQVSWEPVFSEFGQEGSKPIYTEISSEEIQINSSGISNIEFKPTKPGVYMVEVDGGDTLSQTMVWVNGPGNVTWKNVLFDRIELEKDREDYQPGDTAEIFIPNSFVGPVQALISVERGKIISQEVIRFEGSGTIYEFLLEDSASPNVYLSVSIIGINDKGVLSLAQGNVNLPVDPYKYELGLEVIGDPVRSGPGDEVSISIRVIDSDGEPVEGEFSVGVVDKAIYALADPAEQDILSAFYDQKRLGVKTSGSLLVSTENTDDTSLDAGGLGGGGGDAPPALRNDFKDTAYWVGQIKTDSNGEAVVNAVMPDNLTTWKILVRGITLDTKVGEAEIEILTTKELIIRPVTPRFLVSGDHLEIGAFVHNNSNKDLQIGVAIKTVGFVLDNPNDALQEVNIPSGERALLNWWGTAEDIDSVKLIFAAEGGGLIDITTPEMGDIPVLRYLAKQTFSTSGLMDEGGEKLEVISLPPSVNSRGGNLKITLATSLAGAILPGLEVLENNPYESVEGTVSRFLPNLEAYRAVQEFGLEVPELEANLARNLEDALFKLNSTQNYDGGWGWTPGRDSNPYLSAYALLGLQRAKQIGMDINQDILTSATQFLESYLFENSNEFSRSSDYNQASFVFYVLQLTGNSNSNNSLAFDIIRDRLYENIALFDPLGQAFFVLALTENDQTDPLINEIVANLKSNAVRSSTGTHWEKQSSDPGNFSSTILNTSVVLYALAQEDPSSPLIADTVRYLMAHRDVFGAWSSNYSTAWSLLSLVEVMKGTGELGGDFEFSAILNSIETAAGVAGGTDQFTAITTEVDARDLFPDAPNSLLIQREAGAGRLYYSAVLQVSQPVEEVAPLSKDIRIERTYSDPSKDCDLSSCPAIHQGSVNDFVKVTLDITVPNNLYYVVVEDFIPAGAEIVNSSLKTYNYYYDDQSYDVHSPYSGGWGWWQFDNPKIYDDYIYWLADYLPKGTYQLTYTMVLLNSGEYQVIPAHAEQLYFPEVQANSAGENFGILP